MSNVSHRCVCVCNLVCVSGFVRLTKCCVGVTLCVVQVNPRKKETPPQQQHGMTVPLFVMLQYNVCTSPQMETHSCSPKLEWVAPLLLPLSSSHYHIGQGLLIVPRQRGENGERKGIMTARGEKRGSGRKEGQTGYYGREG